MPTTEKKPGDTTRTRALGGSSPSAGVYPSTRNVKLRRGPLSPLTRRATEALAIHHEHRARDFDAAKRYAEQLETHADDRTRRDAAHRLGRLNRKISAKGSLLS